MNKAEVVINLISEVVTALGAVELKSLSPDEIGHLMYEAKGLAKGLTGVYNAGKDSMMETVVANGNIFIASPEVSFKIELGSARVSAKKFDTLLIAEGIDVLRVKTLKEEAKGKRPEQFYVELNGKRP